LAEAGQPAQVRFGIQSIPLRLEMATMGSRSVFTARTITVRRFKSKRLTVLAIVFAICVAAIPKREIVADPLKESRQFRALLFVPGQA
jgi:hypothetical protein